MNKELHYKSIPFEIRETKQTERNGVAVGIIKGFLATFGNFDEGNDTFTADAFNDSIAEHKARDNRPIRMLFQHNRMELVGGFPIELVETLEKGLFVVGEVNLELERGRDVMALARQGILRDMSIGFSIEDFEMKEDKSINILLLSQD